LDYVYFPTTAIVSLLYTMENGATAEMGLTGNDGVVGLLSLWRRNHAEPCRGPKRRRRYSHESEGAPERIRIGGEFQRLLLRYTKR
jgi:hypothetical protein